LENISGCEIISSFNADNQNYTSIDFESIGSDFSIQNGSGYFVYVNQSTSLYLSGFDFGGFSKNLESGWNLLGWYNYSDTWASDVVSDLTSGLTDITKVYYYDSVNQSYGYYNTSGGSGPDFKITQGMGYYVFNGTPAQKQNSPGIPYIVKGQAFYNDGSLIEADNAIVTVRNLETDDEITCNVGTYSSGWYQVGLCDLDDGWSDGDEICITVEGTGNYGDWVGSKNLFVDENLYVHTVDEIKLYENASWWDTSWTHRNRIVINHSMITANIDNFPLLVSHTSGSYIDHAQSDGDDFVFVSNDSSTVFAHEIENMITLLVS